MTNGYIVLTKGEPNLYKHAVEAITLGKPIYYADGNKVAFVNSIELVSTDVVIKTSDKQITVASDGTETEEDTGLYRYYASLLNSNNVKVTIFFNTNKLLGENLTFDDIAKLINTGDFGQTGTYGDSEENIAYVCDNANSAMQITYFSSGTPAEDNFTTLDFYGLIAKIA